MPRAIVVLLTILLLCGCASEAVETPAADGTQPASTPASTHEILEPPAAATHAPAATQTATKEPPPATATIEIADTASPTPSATVIATSTADRSREVAYELAQAVPPVRDNIRLSTAFGDPGGGALSTPPAVETQAPARGARRSFTVLDVVNNTYDNIEAELFAVGDHAYFWFETGPYGLVPDEEILAEIVPAFDDIYNRVTEIFGQENSPGIDGDPRLHVLHASPQTICGVSPDGEGSCATAGFVSSSDLQPAKANPHSNEREMFVMNDRQFGSDYYLGVLAHELRHLTEFNYDVADTDWVKEGSAVLAAELVDLPSGAVGRANEFLSNPDQQLNSWTDIGKGPYYGQGYLFNQYLYDRLGEDIYREFAKSPLPGFLALDDLSEQHGLALPAESLWLDWLAALVLHDLPQAQEKYRFDLDGLATAALNPVDSTPSMVAGDVRQYAADYYELPSGLTTIEFVGSDSVSLLAGQNATDETFWLAQRANSSNPRLTRSVDLRGVDTATLAYDVYADIEYGFDFAYVSLSLDGGTTWLPLAATHMQGLDPADDPSGSAMTPRYYTGRTQEWRHEIIDLTPYAGEELLLRFEMVTDPILTYSGLAVDNVAIPEIGFFDDDGLEGWTAEGFTLATSELPQTWHLQLITFPPEGPNVSQIPVKEDGTAEFKVTGEEGKDHPVLIVAASAPMTLQPAQYELVIEE